nr:serine hydrolase [Desulfobacteraceae bacterium]
MAFESVNSLMAKAVDDHVFPGAVLRVSLGRMLVFENAYGITDIRSGSRADADTVYDLASLTKPLATAPAFMVLVQNGQVGLDTKLASLLPEFE